MGLVLRIIFNQIAQNRDPALAYTIIVNIFYNPIDKYIYTSYHKSWLTLFSNNYG